MTEAQTVADPGRAERGNVYLVGPMGSGKTTLGRRIARRLELDFIDCDHAIEQQTGVSVNIIFDIEGEAGFRERESTLLAEIAQGEGRLVATGGGIVIRASNRRILRETGFVVWLRTPIQHQIDRLSRDRTRPLLQTADRRQRLEKLALERDPLYEEVADLIFDSSHRNVRRQAARLCDSIREHWRGVKQGADHETA